MAKPNPRAQLVVEGKNDKHVVWALCNQHSIEQTFSVETPSEEGGGYTLILDSVPVRVKQRGLEALGLVLDADQNISARWNAIRNRLIQAGYINVPETPQPGGLIVNTQGKPRFGVWLMPNNHLPGMLEDFVSYLISSDDLLKPKVKEILDNIEDENLNQYSPVHHAKAFIHTWLAWQKAPGQPMGQAITAKVLNADADLSQAFVEWLNQLFNA